MRTRSGPGHFRPSPSERSSSATPARKPSPTSSSARARSIAELVTQSSSMIRKSGRSRLSIGFPEDFWIIENDLMAAIETIPQQYSHEDIEGRLGDLLWMASLAARPTPQSNPFDTFRTGPTALPSEPDNSRVTGKSRNEPLLTWRRAAIISSPGSRTSRWPAPLAHVDPKGRYFAPGDTDVFTGPACRRPVLTAWHLIGQLQLV